MARPRKPPHIHGNHGSTSKNNGGNSSSSASSDRAEVKKSSVRSLWKPALGTICLGVAVYIGGLGYLETRVNTPFDDEKVVQQTGLQVPERYWGTYRPGNYFGLKTRDPKSAVFGLMWYAPAKLTNRGDEIRHWCLQDDNLPRYGWLRHDGVTFGEQEIQDPPHSIVTSFIKTPGGQYGGEWTARIQVKQKGNATAAVSLIWYAALEGGTVGRVRKEPRAPTATHAALAGHTPGLGHFRIEFNDVEGDALHESIVATRAPGLHLLRESVASSLRLVRDSKGHHHIVLHDDGVEQHGSDGESQDPNLVAIQLTVVPPYTLDVVYKSAAGGSELMGEEYSVAFARKKKAFDERFEQIFGLTAKGYTGEDVRIARAALSNMVGGVGYWYGAGRVRSQYTREPVPYWRAPLYTAVPSRSFFPRGFLWDEGFHGLLLSRWDVTLQLDIAAHWFDLLNIEGWIPREQILGVEASARVPKEFITQSNGAGNPPMFLIQLATLVRSSPEAFLPGTPGRSTLQRMFPRLQAWYYWFNTTQKGREATAYRWRGRDAETDRELNPKTLTSGLDDFPRASHPTDDERHVDLRCWMYAAADSLVTIASVLDRDPSRFEATRDLLGDEELLNELHWSPYSETYADYGLHSESVRLHRPAAARAAGGPSSNARPEMRRLVVKQPVKKLVTEQFGYVSLFPLLLKVLKPDSPKLGKLLTDLAKPELLWSPYGLRSLSTTSSLFGARNTEHDPPYWRGAVWININYLALAALHHYAGSESPYAEAAGKLYGELRNKVVGNILKEYKRTGYLWEQYSEKDGRGSGCRPFTGWTALVVLIMGEKY